MSDKNVIIIDETEEENLTPEEIEEIERKERLKKIFKTKKSSSHPKILLTTRIASVVGIFGIMFSMLTVSGTALVVSLLILLISMIVNYFVC